MLSRSSSPLAARRAAPLRSSRRSLPFLRSGILSAVTHEPVMVQQIMALMPLRPGSVVVDGTVGLGGHSLRFLERIQPGGVLIGLDWDEQMLAEAAKRLGTADGARVILKHSDFREIKEVLDGMSMRADGILLDLGLNSGQVDDAERGFAFMKPGPLDMRMDRSRGEPAAALLNRMSVGQISTMLHELGDEKWALAIARKIVERRKDAPLRSTKDLMECVLAAIPTGARDKRIHPATRTFQAVRIEVNGELNDLDKALIDAAGSLSSDGVLAVLTYHSGEDRIAKQSFRKLGTEGFVELTKKPLVATEEEVRKNPRSRSAKLRAIQRRQIVQIQ